MLLSKWLQKPRTPMCTFFRIIARHVFLVHSKLPKSLSQIPTLRETEKALLTPDKHPRSFGPMDSFYEHFMVEYLHFILVFLCIIHYGMLQSYPTYSLILKHFVASWNYIIIKDLHHDQLIETSLSRLIKSNINTSNPGQSSNQSLLNQCPSLCSFLNPARTSLALHSSFPQCALCALLSK
jgi:hypothetical protein